MKNLSQLPPVSLFKAVLSDLDGTLTTHGKVRSQTFEALSKLKEIGLKVVVVTGRPAGWADSLLRLWPLDCVIFENGAGIMKWQEGRVVIETLAQTQDVESQRRRLLEIFQRLKNKVPELKLAGDQPYRIFDFALDFAEEPPFLTAEQIDLLMSELSKESGITFKLSNIHINYWCGSHTKLEACNKWLGSLGISKDEVLFTGDSPNDEPLFEAFPYSIGMANILDFKSLTSPPKYITDKREGEGFEQLAQILLGIPGT